MTDKDVKNVGRDERYLAAAGALGGRVGELLLRLPEAMQPRITEIRLRVGRPLCLMEGARPFFLEQDGSLQAVPGKAPFYIERAELHAAFVSVSGWAVHSHQREIIDGFIAVRGGHRAGIAATAVLQDGRVSAVRDVTSINLRVAREIHGAADELIRRCFTGGLAGVLLAGAPASGKTTVLRDLARQLADERGGFYKVCVVDESGELGGMSAGQPGSDLGICSDLLSGYPKARGLQIAVRCLSPQLVICDEICTREEIEAVVAAANSGVMVVTSIHAGSIEELKRKRHFAPLMQTGAFSHLALLAGACAPCTFSQIERVDAQWL